MRCMRSRCASRARAVYIRPPGTSESACSRRRGRRAVRRCRRRRGDGGNPQDVMAGWSSPTGRQAQTQT